MFKIKSSISLLSACLLLIGTAAQADTTPSTGPQMMPPQPLQNNVYQSMIGTWKGDSNMMGKKMHERTKIEWGLNHQFLLMKLKAVGIDNPNMKYEGLGIFGVDNTGKAKVWWFDSWGADSVSTGQGTFDNNKLTITDSNAMFQETRTFDIQANTIVMHATGSMKWQGKDMPFDETTTFKRH